MRTGKRFVAAQIATFCLICITGAFAQRGPACTSFTVVTQDKLNNVNEGLSADDAKWFREKIEKKYPGACYVDPGTTVPLVFYIKVTPDTYHGTRIVTNSSTASNPVEGTITDEDGNVSRVRGTVDTTSTSSTPVPYSFEYGIFTLSVESRRSDGTLQVVQTFQQKGIYNRIYGIPLGGRGHHPAHAVIEDAAKWVSGGGLGQQQSILQPASQVSTSSTNNAATLQAKARAGDAEAQSSLGLLYATGDGVQRDDVQAAVWTRKAAEQGEADAQFGLGYLYFAGQGVPQDYAQAAIWYRKAAEQGEVMAQFNLGLLYSNGQGVPQNDEQAAIWIHKAAEQGEAGAQYRLGLLCFAGQGVPQDFAESYFWFDLAASGKLDSSIKQEALKDRDWAASHLTPADLSQAQARASKWFAEHAVSK